ncbi:MAG: GNAT family N-acetyltransferase [Phycisphaerales bacterium]
MKLIDCDLAHSNAILAIFNEAIANSTALYDYKPRTMEMMTAWFEAKRRGNHPVIGLISEHDNELLGFASYGPFRAFAAYQHTVEHSLYVAAGHRGRGLGKVLLNELIERARGQQYHVLVGGIDSANAASIALHRRFGFKHVATMPEVGFKFGRWLDLCFYQLILTPGSVPAPGSQGNCK